MSGGEKETGDYQLGDDFLADLGGDPGRDSGDTRSGTADGPPAEAEDPTDASRAEVRGEPAAAPERAPAEHERRLEELVNAETEEWAPLDAEGEGPPAQQERGEHATQALPFALPGGAARSRITDGFKAVGRRVRFPILARFFTASLLIIVSVAAATTASMLMYLDGIAEDLAHGGLLKSVEPDLTKVDGGAPQTILILGSDKRPEDKSADFRGLSDTTMLLRVDPERNALALFSLPRDLKVEIPGYGTDKLNAAYAYGGPALTLKTIKRLTGLEVNHLVNVDFEGFARAVNAIDCVYVDVDRRYFNKNVIGDASADYEEIDLQPGYQALCGFDALDYARYRHTDNDVVRAARQQDFLREARQKVPPEVLFADRKELISIFTEHTTSDISDADAMLQVLKLFIEARSAPLKEVHFEGTLGPSFVTTTPAQVQKAVDQFLGIEDTPGARAATAAPEHPADGSSDAPPGQTATKPATPHAARGRKSAGGDPAELVESSFGLGLARGIRSRGPKLPVYYPSVLEAGSDYDQKPRVYKVNGGGEGSPPEGERTAYKWVFSRPALGEYYGFMGTRWRDPPLLQNPSEEREIDGREYKLFYDGDRLRVVAWQTDEGSFWVSNTLIQSLSEREMIEIAKGMTELE